MEQDSHLGQLCRRDGQYRQVNFAPRLKTLMARLAGRYRCRTASVSELRKFSALARQEIGSLAADEVLFKLQALNPDIFQVVLDTQTDRKIGFNAQLPLTDKGLVALIDAEFDAFAPDPDHIARSGEGVTAIYAWLTYAPRNYVAVVAALSDYLDGIASRGCSIFCRAANPLARKTFTECGFEDARYSYPDAPEGLLVVHPAIVEAQKRQRPKLDVRLARSPSDLAMITAIRGATYMAEQACPFSEEFDGNDLCAAHLIGHVDGEPAGCMRIRFFGGFVKFERLAVRREFRRSPLAFALVRAGIEYAAQKGFTRVYGHARHDLEGFWARFGFRRRPDRDSFVFSDVTYVEMEGDIASLQPSVTLEASPYVLIRPEGSWEKPGPLERPANHHRQRDIEARLVNRHARPTALPTSPAADSSSSPLVLAS